jgi:hypothetical protein
MSIWAGVFSGVWCLLPIFYVLISLRLLSGASLIAHHFFLLVFLYYQLKKAGFSRNFVEECASPPTRFLCFYFSYFSVQVMMQTAYHKATEHN